ncbi:hypothetical protein SLEP1_g46326 [Rubroshorea leprosula]|uniref:CNNM transmembrane domain-containing protein n=1 Tax=Rubroshorea leprosula TaxID=152421 RepID=A0AAV5LPH5_9ROSI|nr:hypothetical protein SLEP1_g46326 [Rubroshorea leprosula]
MESFHNRGTLKILLKLEVFIGAMLCCLLVFACKRVLAVEGVVNAKYGVIEQWALLLRNAWPKVSMILKIFKEQGVILTALLGLSAFFSMAETSISTLWPCKDMIGSVLEMKDAHVREILAANAQKLNAVHFEQINNGEAMSEAKDHEYRLLTEITPKSIAVHNPTEVARFVASGMAFLDATSSGKNCYLFINGNKEIISTIYKHLSFAFLVSSCSEPYVSEDELKLMLCGAKLSGAIEEEEQDMIETALEIKDTHVREAITPLVNVVAIDASATLVDFHHLWVTHQYSR